MADHVLMPNQQACQPDYPRASQKWILKEFWVYHFFIVLLTPSSCEIDWSKCVMILAVSLKKCTKSFSKVEDSDLAHFSENGKKSEIKNLLYKPILVHRSFLHFSHQCILLFKLGFSTKMLNNKKWLQNCKQISRRYIDLTKKCLLKNLE